MLNIRLIIGAYLLTVLSACATAPTKEQLATADYGRDLSSDECSKIAESFIANQLKDPASAQFRNETCEKGYWQSVPILGLPVAFGWLQQGEVNAKNSFGGYVGYSMYQVLIKNDSVLRYCITDSDGYCMVNAVKQ